MDDYQIVKIDKDLIKEVKKLVNNKELRIDYTSIQDFINKAVRDRIINDKVRLGGYK